MADKIKENVESQKLELFLKPYAGTYFERALEKVAKEKRVIASNKDLDQALIPKNLIVRDEADFDPDQLYNRVWSGTLTAYVEPDEKLGEEVEYVDPVTSDKWIFPVPKQYSAKKNAILISEYPNYTIKSDGKKRLVHATKVDLIELFPAENGWYLTDSVYRIPIGKQVDLSDPNTRCLVRTNKGGFPICRDILSREKDICIAAKTSSEQYGVVVK
ncbi:hypothetical protein HYT84_03680 [Candidatus Micrarchaeota archaeon]|nr:hypothetical protein [Candidatus Micrarchaeota archaeon]